MTQAPYRFTVYVHRYTRSTGLTYTLSDSREDYSCGAAGYDGIHHITVSPAADVFVHPRSLQCRTGAWYSTRVVYSTQLINAFVYDMRLAGLGPNNWTSAGAPIVHPSSLGTTKGAPVETRSLSAHDPHVARLSRRMTQQSPGAIDCTTHMTKTAFGRWTSCP